MHVQSHANDSGWRLGTLCKALDALQDRHFAVLLGRCIEEAASVRVEPHGNAQAEVSLHGGVAGCSVSCGVRLSSPVLQYILESLLTPHWTSL